jgi:hypothetical protein
MKEFSISIWIKEEGFSYIHGEVYIWFGIQQNGWLGIAHSAPNPDTTLYVNYSVGANDFIDGPYLRLFDYGTRNSLMFYSLVYSNGYINAYLNGKWIGSKQQNLKFSSNFAAIGRHWWFDVDNLTIVNTSARFTGSVDDVRIYNIALTNDEVDSLYNNTFSDVESLNSTLIDNNSIDRISVYPNPATTYTKVSYIRSTSNFISSISAEIVDQFGRIVAECQSKSSEQNNINDKIFGKVEFYFNTDELSNGLYAIIVNDNNNLYSTKLIINK